MNTSGEAAGEDYFTRGFAASEFPRGLRQGGSMAVLPLARSRIPPATQAQFLSWKVYGPAGNRKLCFSVSPWGTLRVSGK